METREALPALKLLIGKKQKQKQTTSFPIVSHLHAGVRGSGLRHRASICYFFNSISLSMGFLPVKLGNKI